MGLDPLVRERHLGFLDEMSANFFGLKETDDDDQKRATAAL
jgi:hypothetical protein